MVGAVYFLGLVAATLTAAQDTNQPLFSYETNALTDGTLKSLIASTPGAAANDALFAFDDARISTLDRLKSGACKVFPGGADWPSQAVWHVFDKLLGEGALIETVPLAAPCYQNLVVFSTEKCAAVRSGWADPYLHERDPTSTFWPLFQGRTCLPINNATNGNCTLGAFPVYTVNVSSVRQVQLAVNFARNANLRLVVKNTGHCYLGKSSGAGALSIWTHNLKDTTFYPHLAIPGHSGPALKVGAGVTVREVYEKAHENNVSALGGICESVGYAGGYIAGGGHTPLSGLYGMAADHVMALEVVTADGRFVTASPQDHPDLFWALRGGGGGTYGVVTSIIIRVHPKLPVVTSVFSFGTSPSVSADVFWEGLRSFFQLFIPFTDAGTYSWWTLNATPDGKDFTFNMAPFFAPNHSIETFNALVKPWFDRLASLNIPIMPVTKAYDSFYPAYQATWGSDVGLNSAGSTAFVPGNWLLPRGNWEDPAKFNATFAVIRKHSSAGRLLFGYHQAPRNRANVDNAVSPAFRHVISMLIVSSGLPPGDHPTPAQVKTATDDLINNIITPLRAVAPESAFGGSYLNEANVDQPDWQAAFYGAANYARLLGIKSKYDPRHVFYATTAVGSEGWEVQDGEQGTQTQNGRLCRV